MTERAVPLGYKAVAVKTSLRLAVLALLLLGWQIGAWSSGALGIPSVVDTVGAAVSLMADGTLLKALAVTNQAMVIGFVISVIVSVPLGIVMGLSPPVRRVADPYIGMMLAIPMVALLPVVQVAFGLTLTSRVVIVILFSMAYIVVNTMVGVRSTDERLVEMARSYNATRRQILMNVVLPSAVPGIFAGIRLGIGRAIMGMIVAELVLVSAGIGSLILDYQASFENEYVFGILAVAILEGIVIVQLAAAVERKFSWWQEAA